MRRKWVCLLSPLLLAKNSHPAPMISWPRTRSTTSPIAFPTSWAIMCLWNLWCDIILTWNQHFRVPLSKLFCSSLTTRYISIYISKVSSSIIQSVQIRMFHQPRFPWSQGNSLPKPPFGVKTRVTSRNNLTRLYNHHSPPFQNFPSWWLNNPSEKICDSQTGNHLPQIVVKILKKYLSCLGPSYKKKVKYLHFIGVSYKL